MPRVAVLLVGLAALLAVGSQLLLPPVLEGRVADRLERGGGKADVSLRALPAARLLFDHGSSLKVEGHDLRLPLGGREQVLDRLDGFDEVRVHLHRVRVPPLSLRSFFLARAHENGDYAVRMSGTTTPREVGRFLGGVLGDLAAGALPGGGRERLPVDVGAIVRSRQGRREVVSARGTVAGVPAGPLVGVVLDAVVRRL
jgi:hypothetical protein